MASSNGKPAQAEEGKGAAEGSIGGYESLHRLLEANLSPELFQVPSITPPGRGRPDSSRRVVVPRPCPFLGSWIGCRIQIQLHPCARASS